jgi:ferredoxin
MPGDLEIVEEGVTKMVVLREKVVISRTDCGHCRICVDNCPAGAIKIDGWCRQVIPHRCDGCGVCIEICPKDLIGKTKILAPIENIQDDERETLTKSFPEAPRQIDRAANWLKKYKDHMLSAATQLAASLNKLNEDNILTKEGAEAMVDTLKMLNTCGNAPYSTLEHASTRISRGFLNPRDTARREIEGVLKQFDRVSYNNRLLTVTTKKDIVVRGVNFGKFMIQVQLSDDTVFATALNPNWAADRNRASHPHTERDGGKVCLGAAAEAYAAALKEGRICDALLLVQSVLNEYGADSPYHLIDNWIQKTCSICAAEGARYNHVCAKGVDHRYVCDDCAIFCSHCGKPICEDCLGQCSTCDAPLCALCTQMELCEHKNDIRNKDWEDKFNYAQEQKGEAKAKRFRQRVEHSIVRQVSQITTALAKRKEEEEKKRKEAEQARLREEEALRFKKLSVQEQRKYVVGHESPEGYAGFLGDDDIDTIREAHIEPTYTESDGETPVCARCGSTDWCLVCNACHECGYE